MRAGGPRPRMPSRTSARSPIYLYWLQCQLSPTGFRRPFLPHGNGDTRSAEKHRERPTVRGHALAVSRPAAPHRTPSRPCALAPPAERATPAGGRAAATSPGSGTQTARRPEPQHRPGGRRTLDSGFAPSSTGPRPSRPAPAYRAPRTGHSCAPVQWRGPQPARAVASWAAEVETAPQGRRGPFADRRCCSRRGRGWL